MKKKLAAMTIAGIMALSMVACGGSDSASSAASSAPAAASEAEAVASEAEPAAEAESAAAESEAEAEAASSSAAEETAAASDAGGEVTIEEGLDGSGVKVGIVVKTLADQYWTLVKAGAEDATEAYGSELTFIAPSNDETVLPALQQAVDQGIKVIAVETDSSLPDKSSFIGTGNEAAAKEGAVWAGQQIGEGKKAIVLRGRLGDATHDAREAGLVAGLEETGVEILEVQAADSTEEKGMQVAENLLNKYQGEVDLIITTADSMATGAMNAIEKGGYTDVQVMGFDGTFLGVTYVTEGKWLGTTAQSPYNMGLLAVTNAIKLAHGETIEERIDSGQTVVGPDNAADFLADLQAKVGA